MNGAQPFDVQLLFTISNQICIFVVLLEMISLSFPRNGAKILALNGFSGCGGENDQGNFFKPSLGLKFGPFNPKGAPSMSLSLSGHILTFNIVFYDIIGIINRK